MLFRSAGDDDLLLGEPEATTTTEADAALGLGPDTSATIHGSALPGHDPHADDQALLADPGPADDSATGPVAGGAGGVDREVVRERPPARRRGAAMVGAAALVLAALAGSFALGRASADDDSSPSGLAGTSGGPPGWHDDDVRPGPDQGPGWPGRHDDGEKGPRSDWGDGIHWPSRGEGRHGHPSPPDDRTQKNDDD